jgi:adenine-specific DNA methylase
MATRKEQLTQEVAKAVGASKAVAMETVDFSDPNRPKTCLEVDFPILLVNQVAAIEGPASKPIYQMSKWWARRRSSVFRSMLIAAATKAPNDPAHAAKLVWDNYYANHQKKAAFKHLKVADIFMGGGTTLVEGARLGMQLFGNDLNPVAWFVVKQELADVDIGAVKQLLADIETEVKPQIMPFYYCDGPKGEKGIWTHKPSQEVMARDFDPLRIPREKRHEYAYAGPEIIYAFWAKHGPCHVTGCGHRTPIMSSPVMAVKTLTVKSWQHTCPQCKADFDIEEKAARMAPDVPLFIANNEKAFSILNSKGRITCPRCSFPQMIKLGKSQNKKIELSLLVHPEWLAGAQSVDSDGSKYGGSTQDESSATISWNRDRSAKVRLLEVRGTLPDEVTCPETGVSFATGKAGGNVPGKAKFSCASCGTVNEVLTAVKVTKKNGPIAAYAIHAYSERRKVSGAPYNGRFFAPFGEQQARQMNAAIGEWEERRESDLALYWPRTEIPDGFMTTHNNGDIKNGHGYRYWSDMFNARELLALSLILRAILNVGSHAWETREYVLGCFQQYVRNNNNFTIWNTQADQLEPMFSNNNFHPKQTTVENCVFGEYGRGNWNGCARGIIEGLEWARDPWDIVAKANLEAAGEIGLAEKITGKGMKVTLRDPVRSADIRCQSSTNLDSVADASLDLIITDPPFGGLLHYSELSDFFYVWLRLALKGRYPEQFSAPSTPKALEAVSNRAREPDDPDGFYKRILTDCWKEASRALKSAGLMSFTFHHSADEPWIAVLESLFDAGFYLEATYPIRSDETKGEGAKPGTFGSQQIEYDIIHVCRKRTQEPKPVSWARMRREVLQDVRLLQQLLEHHAKGGLPEADIHVIKRGKALEYFSRHYGKVYVDEGRPISVKEALVGINQLIDETGGKSNDPPPVTAEPITRQFLRIFDSTASQPRDQMQKFLRGSGMAPEEFEERGWSKEEQKVFHVVSPVDLAQSWAGRHRRNMTSDYDQAMFLIGACYDGSGINAAETLKNENFRPHPALKALLEWHSRRGAKQEVRNAASRALSIYQNWENTHQDQVKQLSFFEDA